MLFVGIYNKELGYAKCSINTQVRNEIKKEDVEEILGMYTGKRDFIGQVLHEYIRRHPDNRYIEHYFMVIPTPRNKGKISTSVREIDGFYGDRGYDLADAAFIVKPILHEGEWYLDLTRFFPLLTDIAPLLTEDFTSFPYKPLRPTLLSKNDIRKRKQTV